MQYGVSAGLQCSRHRKQPFTGILPSWAGFQEPVPYGPSRHSHRALYDHDILFLRIQIRLLIGRIRVTFLCGHETGRHLDAVGSQTELAQHVLMVKDPSSRHHRDLLFILSGKLLHHTDDAADLRFILLSFIRF